MFGRHVKRAPSGKVLPEGARFGVPRPHKEKPAGTAPAPVSPLFKDLGIAEDQYNEIGKDIKIHHTHYQGGKYAYKRHRGHNAENRACKSADQHMYHDFDYKGRNVFCAEREREDFLKDVHTYTTPCNKYCTEIFYTVRMQKSILGAIKY